MNYYKLKAILANGDAFPFTLADLPVPIGDGKGILLNKPNSPIIDLLNLRRGDTEYNLYEGDVIIEGDTNWLVCFERGFYVINEAGVVKYFNQLSDYTVIGTKETIPIKIPIKLKRKHLFRYKTTMFYLQDIVAAVNGKLLISMFVDPIDVGNIAQECGCTYNNKKAFLGDATLAEPIHLEHGRIIIDGHDVVMKGGTSDGCNL